MHFCAGKVQELLAGNAFLLEADNTHLFSLCVFTEFIVKQFESDIELWRWFPPNDNLTNLDVMYAVGATALGQALKEYQEGTLNHIGLGVDIWHMDYTRYRRIIKQMRDLDAKCAWLDDEQRAIRV